MGLAGSHQPRDHGAPPGRSTGPERPCHAFDTGGLHKDPRDLLGRFGAPTSILCVGSRTVFSNANDLGGGNWHLLPDPGKGAGNREQPKGEAEGLTHMLAAKPSFGGPSGEGLLFGQTPLQLRNPSNKGGFLPGQARVPFTGPSGVKKGKTETAATEKVAAAEAAWKEREREKRRQAGGREKRARAGGHPWASRLRSSLAQIASLPRTEVPSRKPTEPPFANRTSEAKGFLHLYRMLPALGPLKEKEIQGTPTPFGRSLPALPLSCSDPSRTENSPRPGQGRSLRGRNADLAQVKPHWSPGYLPGPTPGKSQK